MRYVSAYLLSVLGGNESPTVADIKAILASVGVEVDEERLSALMKSMEGKVRFMLYILKDSNIDNVVFRMLLN